jgi:ABC-type Zn2+ transport system substrate-binding protein/surface adhesin
MDQLRTHRHNLQRLATLVLLGSYLCVLFTQALCLFFQAKEIILPDSSHKHFVFSDHLQGEKHDSHAPHPHEHQANDHHHHGHSHTTAYAHSAIQLGHEDCCEVAPISNFQVPVVQGENLRLEIKQAAPLACALRQTLVPFSCRNTKNIAKAFDLPPPRAALGRRIALHSFII